MKFALLILLSFAAVIDVALGVVGGSDVPDHKYPYLVSIRKHPTGINTHMCTGTILNKRWILTVATYLIDETTKRPIHPSTITVQVGSNILSDKEGLIYRVDNVTYHKDYNSLQKLNNIGLVRVDRDLVFNEKIQPIVLPQHNNFEPNTTAVITGWGAGWIGGSISLNLKEVSVNLTSQKICNDYWEHKWLYPIHITEMHICSLIEEGKGACHNDFGDPLLVNGTQVGIHSFMKGCGDGNPQIFTRVFTYLDWIKENAVIENTSSQ